MGVVVSLPTAAMDYYLYGDNSNTVANYLQNQISNINMNGLTEFGNKMLTGLQSAYTYVTDSFIKSGIYNSLRGIGLNVSGNYVQNLQTFEQLTSANLTMQRWIMANPEVRQIYNDGNCDGYSETYVDMFPKTIGASHYDYRRVTNGVAVEEGDKFVIKRYDEDLLEGDRELSHEDKMAILSTWNSIEFFTKQCRLDFTNPVCSEDNAIDMNR